MYKVAFIDDGIMDRIQESPKHVRKYKVNNGKVQEREQKSKEVCLSHGTMCFWVFAEYIEKKEYILYDIQILDEHTSKGNLKDLECALQFCLDEGIDLINMSLGKLRIIDLKEEKILKKLYENGTIMVAAQNNSNQVTFPACSSYVLGVSRDYTGTLKKDQFCYIDDKSEKLDIICHCDFSDIEHKHNIIMGKQNSFSAPYISALIFNELQKGRTREAVLCFLREKSLYADRLKQWNSKKQSIPDWHEEIDVPVISLEVTKRDSRECFEKIIKIFQSKEYHAVGIWLGKQILEENIAVFQYQWNKKYQINVLDRILKWVFNISRPDIMFIGHDLDSNIPVAEMVDLRIVDDITKKSQKLDSVCVCGKSVGWIAKMITDHFE